MTTRMILALLLLSGLAVGGCSVLESPAGPQACAQVYDADRCLAMTVSVAFDLGIDPDAVTSLEILPEPTPEVRDGQMILTTHSGGPTIEVSVTTADGIVRPGVVHCEGVASGPACVSGQHLSADSILHGGYMDTPCAGEPPDGCATPVPTVDPEAAADATELRVARLDIPIDHVGEYEIKLGEARLPNGLLSAADFAYVDDTPDGIIMLSNGASIQIRSLEPDGLPFSNIFEHGWRPGVERVEAVLAFHVDHFEPGASLSIKDVVVR